MVDDLGCVLLLFRFLLLLCVLLQLLLLLLELLLLQKRHVTYDMSDACQCLRFASLCRRCWCVKVEPGRRKQSTSPSFPCGPLVSSLALRWHALQPFSHNKPSTSSCVGTSPHLASPSKSRGRCRITLSYKQCCCVVLSIQVGNANPDNERAQARVYALWTFAKAYVADKDRVAIDAGKGAEIKVRSTLKKGVDCRPP